MDLFDIFNLILTVFLLFIGIYFTVRTKGHFIFHIPKTVKLVFRSIRTDGSGGMKAMLLAVGGTVGIGNIAGVTTAIAIGGPGAIFWMWLCGALSMVTKYMEVRLGMETKGGPFGYIRKNLGRIGGYVFTFACLACALILGNVFQANSAITTVTVSFNIPEYVAAIVYSLPILILMWCRRDKVETVAAYLVPLMSLAYLFFTGGIIISHASALPKVFLSIITGIGGWAPVGGFAGAMILHSLREGVAKGLFSHEAGIGTAPLAFLDKNISSHIGGCWGVVEVIADTGIVSTLTALAVLSSGFYSEDGMASVTAMIAQSYGTLGSRLFSVTVAIFSFSSMLAWLVYGKLACDYLPEKTVRPAKLIFSVLFLILIPLSFLLEIDFLWNSIDIILLCMALPNLYSLWRERRCLLSAFKKDVNQIDLP